MYRPSHPKINHSLSIHHFEKWTPNLELTFFRQVVWLSSVPAYS